VAAFLKFSLACHRFVLLILEVKRPLKPPKLHLSVETDTLF